MIGLVFALIFLVAVVGTVYRLAFKVWQGDERSLRTMRSSLTAFPFGNGVKNGMVRASVALAAQVTCIIGAVVSGVIGTDGTPRGQLSPGLVVAFVFLAGVVLLMGVEILIICVNRPSFLVPPSLRNERGTLQKLES